MKKYIYILILSTVFYNTFSQEKQLLNYYIPKMPDNGDVRFEYKNKILQKLFDDLLFNKYSKYRKLINNLNEFNEKYRLNDTTWKENDSKVLDSLKNSFCRDYKEYLIKIDSIFIMLNYHDIPDEDSIFAFMSIRTQDTILKYLGWYEGRFICEDTLEQSVCTHLPFMTEQTTREKVEEKADNTKNINPDIAIEERDYEEYKSENIKSMGVTISNTPVYPSPNTNSVPIVTIGPYETITIIEKQELMVKVNWRGGLDGWIEKSNINDITSTLGLGQQQKPEREPLVLEKPIYPIEDINLRNLFSDNELTLLISNIKSSTGEALRLLNPYSEKEKYYDVKGNTGKWNRDSIHQIIEVMNIVKPIYNNIIEDSKKVYIIAENMSETERNEVLKAITYYFSNVDQYYFDPDLYVEDELSYRLSYLSKIGYQRRKALKTDDIYLPLISLDSYITDSTMGTFNIYGRRINEFGLYLYKKDNAILSWSKRKNSDSLSIGGYYQDYQDNDTTVNKYKFISTKAEWNHILSEDEFIWSEFSWEKKIYDKTDYYSYQSYNIKVSEKLTFSESDQLESYCFLRSQKNIKDYYNNFFAQIYSKYTFNFNDDLFSILGQFDNLKYENEDKYSYANSFFNPYFSLKYYFDDYNITIATSLESIDYYREYYIRTKDAESFAYDYYQIGLSVIKSIEENEGLTWITDVNQWISRSDKFWNNTNFNFRVSYKQENYSLYTNIFFKQIQIKNCPYPIKHYGNMYFGFTKYYQIDDFYLEITPSVSSILFINASTKDSTSNHLNYIQPGIQANITYVAIEDVLQWNAWINYGAYRYLESIIDTLGVSYSEKLKRDEFAIGTSLIYDYNESLQLSFYMKYYFNGTNYGEFQKMEFFNPIFDRKYNEFSSFITIGYEL